MASACAPRLGGHFQTGQDFHLFAAMVEGSILAHQGVHTAHPRRELGCLPHPVRHRPGTVPGDSAGTGSRGAALGPCRPRSAGFFPEAPDSWPYGRSYREADAVRGQAERTATIRSGPWPQPDVRQSEWPSRWPLNPNGQSCAVRRKSAAGVALFPARLPAGWFPPFFFLGRRPGPSHWPQPADLFINVQKLLSQFPEALTFGNLALRFGQTSRRGKRLGDRFPVHLACQPVVGTVAGLTGPMAMTVWISTAPNCFRNGA